MALGSTGKSGQWVGLTTFHVPVVMKSGSINLLEPSGPVQGFIIIITIIIIIIIIIVSFMQGIYTHYYYYYYYYYYLLPFHSVAVVLTLVTNKNKYT